MLIYLDNAATTQVHPDVKAAMDEWQNYANAGSIHRGGMEAKEQIDKARRSVANLLNCADNQVIFTSGGSESNATVLRGHKQLYGSACPGIAFSAVEHESVCGNVGWLSMLCCDKSYITKEVPVSRYGTVDLDALCSVVDDPRIKLVSVMTANNEIPAVNNIAEIAQICHENRIAFHTDAVQAVGTVELDVRQMQCDYMSLSAHKFHGPKGIGVLYCRDKSTLYPLIAGSGSQEFGMRGGTENVSAIIGLGVAAQIAKNEELADIEHITLIKHRFYAHLMKRLSDSGLGGIAHYNGFSPMRAGKIISLTFDGVDAQSLVLALSAKSAYISAGSACHAHSSTGSRVLKAIGLTEEQAHSTVRISFSKFNTETEVLQTADIIAETVEQFLSYTHTKE